MPTRRAFTLIELLVVMTIIAVLMSLVIGGFALIKEQAEVLKTRDRMQKVQNALTLINRDGRSGADLIMETMRTYRLEFKPLRQVMNALQSYWFRSENGELATTVKIEPVDQYLAGGVGIGATHLDKLPPLLWSKYDPLLGHEWINLGNTSHNGCWTVLAKNHRRLSPQNMPLLLENILLGMSLKSFHDAEAAFLADDELPVAVCPWSLRPVKIFYRNINTTALFDVSGTLAYPRPTGILKTKLNAVQIAKYRGGFSGTQDNVVYAANDFVNLNLWYYPTTAADPVHYRYAWLFNPLEVKSLNTLEAYPRPMDPSWAGIFDNTSPPAWMGSGTAAKMLWGPHKYYEMWPNYVEIKQGLGDNPADNDQLGNLWSEAPIIYSYAWPSTDWDQQDPGTVPPIFEMPFGQFMLTRNGQQVSEYQQRPYRTPTGDIAAGPRTLAQFTPMHTIAILQMAEIVLPGAAGAEAYRTNRGVNEDYNDAWGNPIFLAAAGFLAPRYALYDIDRSDPDDMDRCRNYEIRTGEPEYRPWAEFSNYLRGGRDYLLQRTQDVYGNYRQVYLTVAALGLQRGVFGHDNDIATVLPSWESAEQLKWPATLDRKVLRAAWWQVIDLAGLEAFSDAEMADSDFTIYTKAERDEYLSVFMPPMALQ
jgi:prepilin-type N-terminal cleavage/methylation domain-containing protein